MPKYFEKAGLQIALAELEGEESEAYIIPRKHSEFPVIKMKAAASLVSGSWNPPLSIPFHFIIHLPPGVWDLSNTGQLLQEEGGGL